MASHNDLGKLGEQHAVLFLRDSGFEILAVNWVYLKAEIDIIARRGNTVSMVEVKTRSSTAFGLPQEFVTPKKIRTLLVAVNEYMRRYCPDCEVQFDIVAVTRQYGRFNIEYVPDAFYYF